MGTLLITVPHAPVIARIIMGAVVQGRPALRASTRASSADALGHYLSIGLDVLPRAYRGANALSEDDGAYGGSSLRRTPPDATSTVGLADRVGMTRFPRSRNDP
jgi:hypothetical protein